MIRRRCEPAFVFGGRIPTSCTRSALSSSTWPLRCAGQTNPAAALSKTFPGSSRQPSSNHSPAFEGIARRRVDVGRSAVQGLIEYPRWTKNGPVAESSPNQPTFRDADLAIPADAGRDLILAARLRHKFGDELTASSNLHRPTTIAGKRFLSRNTKPFANRRHQVFATIRLRLNG